MNIVGNIQAILANKSWSNQSIADIVISLIKWIYSKRDYNQNGTHHNGMWGCQEGLNPKFQSLCSKNEAAQNDEFCIMCHLIQNFSFCGGVGLAPLHFSSKDFKILDLDPPINATFHYGACHFGYNLALTQGSLVAHL